MKTTLLAAALASALCGLGSPARAFELSDSQWDSLWASLDDAIAHGAAPLAVQDCKTVTKLDPSEDRVQCTLTWVWAGYTFTNYSDRQPYGHEAPRWLKQVCNGVSCAFRNHP